MLAKQRAGGKRKFAVEIDSLSELTTLIRSPSLIQCNSWIFRALSHDHAVDGYLVLAVLWIFVLCCPPLCRH